jgi:1-acyl-sn-glycerol-3-phosphate acyltransferase
MPDEPLELNADKTLVYRLAAGIVAALSWVLFRPRVVGRANIPESGPVLIAPIHRSNLDFAFTLFISKRKVFFMAKDTLFARPLIGRLLRHLGAFPVHRGAADREAMTLSEEVLRRGYALVLFPEGTRREGEDVAALHDGAMFVAARTGAAVVPVGVGGTERILPKGAKVPRLVRVRIVVGAPITAPAGEGRVSRSAISAKTEDLRRELQAVYHQSLGLD